VEQLNSTMQEILLGRLKEAIVKWTTVFSSDDHSSEIYSHKGRKLASTNEDKLKSRQINLKPIFHELIIRNQVIFLEPPLEHARTICFSSLYQWLGTLNMC
jgi:dynein heavy chain 1, cytosolic